MGKDAKNDIETRWNWNSYASELIEVYNGLL